jgi:hypothetical protein
VEELLVGCEFEVGDGAGSNHGPAQRGGGTAVGMIPSMIPTSRGSRPPITGPNGPNKSSQESRPSGLLSPGGPITMTGDESDAVGTATMEVYDGGATKVTTVALAGGIILLSDQMMSTTIKADGENIPYSKWA